MDWAEKIEKPMAVLTAWNRWAESDLQSAAGWLDTHQDSPEYTGIAYGCVQRLNAQPERATQIANSIPDPQIRSQALAYIDHVQAAMKSLKVTGRE